MKKLQIYFLLYILLNLHLLRNISFKSYIFVLSLIYFPILVYCFSNIWIIEIKWIAVWYSLFFLSGLWAAMSTFLGYGSPAAAYATGRYFMTMPMVIIAYLFITTPKDVKKTLMLFCVIVMLGAATIPMQYIVGPISWFSEPGERAAITRYASLLGSLTTAGSMIPIAIFVSLVLRIRRLFKSILIAGLSLGAILSLQKAALLGIPLAVGLHLLFIKKMRIKKIVFGGVFVIALIGILNLSLKNWPVWKQASGYMLAAFKLNKDPEALGGDVSIFKSIIDRITLLPRNSLRDLKEYRGELGYLLGGGFGMVGPALMRPDDSPYITAHNGYVDFILIGGVIHLVAFLGLIYATIIPYRRMIKQCNRAGLKDEIPVCCYGILIIVLISLFFGGGFTFQPIASTLLWSLVGISWRLENRQMDMVEGEEISPFHFYSESALKSNDIS